MTVPTRIAYRAGYNYQLVTTYRVQLSFRPPRPITSDWIDFDADGRLTLRAGYAWDGPSGPAIDTRSFMRGSAVHDGLYQLLREGLLPREFRGPSDQELRRLCREDGMPWIRAWWVYWSVRLGAGPAANPAHARPVEYAP